jgi:hypothetical protein
MTEGQLSSRCFLRRSLASAASACNASLLALVSLCILQTACTYPYRHAQLRPADAGFSGIDDAFGAQTPEVDVLLVHGMGTHDASWVQTLVTPLARALGFPVPSELPTPEPLKNGAQLYRFELTQSGQQLHIAAVLWSPVTSPAKKTLCYDANQVTPLCTDSTVLSHDKRAWLNGYLKSQIMDDRLSDVTFYLNEDGGRQIREAIEDALLRSLSTEAVTLDQVSTGVTPTAKSAPLFLISESLGSKIVVDSLQTLEDSRQTQQFAQRARGNVHTLFLLANQIPILNLGIRDTAGQPDPYQHLKTFAKSRNAYRSPGLPAALHVVAFSDPNDIFSYQLPTGVIPHEDAIISNVLASNAHTFLGVYESLDGAHTCYIQTTPVANTIAHGSGTLAKSVGAHCSS